MHVGQAGRPGPARRAARGRGAAGAGGDRPSRRRRRAVLRELGLTDVADARAATCTGALGAGRAREGRRRPWSTTACRCCGFAVQRPEPGGRVRLAHRGGLRCQRLTWRRRCRRRPASRRRAGRSARLALRFLRSELRLIFGRRRNLAGLARARRRPGASSRSRSRCPPPAPGRRAGLPRLDHRQRAVRRARRADRRAGRCSCRSRWRAIAGDSVAGEANIGTLRYLLAVPVGRTRLLAVKYAGDRDLLASPRRCWSRWSASVVGLALFGAGDDDPAVRHPGRLRLTGCPAAAADLRLPGAVLRRPRRDRAVRLHPDRAADRRHDRHRRSSTSLMLHPRRHPAAGLAAPVAARRTGGLSFGDLLRDPIAWDALGRGLLTAGCLRRWCSGSRPGPASPARTSPADCPRRHGVPAGAVAGRLSLPVGCSRRSAAPRRRSPRGSAAPRCAG